MRSKIRGMKAIVTSVIAVLALGFAGCAKERETVVTTTTSSSNRPSSTTDTSALDPSRNTNMQPVMSNPMGMGPR